MKISRQHHAKLKAHSYRLDSREFSLEELHTFLSDHKVFLLALLENPQLFEHDRFTDLLHAVFHLAEELVSRDRLVNLPAAGLQSPFRGFDTGIQPARDRMAGIHALPEKEIPVSLLTGNEDKPVR